VTGDHEPSASGWVREHVAQIARTGTTDGVTINGLPTVLMTYRGATTAKVRKTPVMRVEHEGRYAAVASKGGAPTNPPPRKAAARSALRSSAYSARGTRRAALRHDDISVRITTQPAGLSTVTSFARMIRRLKPWRAESRRGGARVQQTASAIVCSDSRRSARFRAL
jgi:hypothetical protein